MFFPENPFDKKSTKKIIDELSQIKPAEICSLSKIDECGNSEAEILSTSSKIEAKNTGPLKNKHMLLKKMETENKKICNLKIITDFSGDLGKNNEKNSPQSNRNKIHHILHQNPLSLWC